MIELLGTLLGTLLALGGLAVGISVGVVGHELAHYAVARYYGLDAGIELDGVTRVGPFTSGRVELRPYSVEFDVERLPTSVSRRISFAPVVLFVPAFAVIWLVDATALLGAAEIPAFTFAFGLGLTGLPSPSDRALADHDHRILLDLERQYALRRHADAEGLEGPSAADVVETAVERRRSA